MWGVEVGLIAEGLYAGTADGIGMFNGEPSIIDFKTAKKIKNVSGLKIISTARLYTHMLITKCSSLKSSKLLF